MEEMGKHEWVAPKLPGEVVFENFKVTGRPWEILYERLYVQDEIFIGKTVISLGNGVSDLPEHINKLKKETHCYGVDPIYDFLGETMEEFHRNLFIHGLEPHSNQDLFSEEIYKSFKKGMKEGIYIAATGEELPFRDASVDMVVACELIGNIGDQKVVLKIIDEMLRVLKPDGEIRISDLNLVTNDDNSASVDLNETYVPINAKESIDWMEILMRFQKANCKIYLVKDLEGVKLHTSYSNEEIGIVPGYRGIVIRRDGKIPRITYLVKDLRGEREIETDKSIAEIDEIDLKSNRTLNFKPIDAEVLLVPKSK